MGAMSVRVGIEAIAAHPGTLVLPMAALLAARGRDVDELRDSMRIDERSVCVPWEDPVTMAVNAALPLLGERERETIGLVIVASESGVDQEKSMSTWVQRYLGLSSRVRNIEIKHACYGATAGVQLAASWVASQAAPGEKALVISTDQSRPHFGKPWEYVMGAAAVAMIVSNRPRILELELGAHGVYTHEVSDLTRPTPYVETGNSETSLLSYLDGLEAAYDDYVRRVPAAVDFRAHFQRVIYHLPFAGMGVVAHRAMLRTTGITSKAEARADYARVSEPSIAFARRLGGTYGASTFLSLMSLLCTDSQVAAGDRIGMFAYGSGSCAEWWSGTLGPEARKIAGAANLPGLLDARRTITVAEYEAVESARVALIDSGEYTTDRGLCGDWYDRAYARQHRLVFDGMHEYYRAYSWSDA